MASKKKKAWKSDSEDGAFLFLLYHFRVYHPNDYSAVEIYDHPDFPFKDNYAKKNFNTHCQTLSNRCNNYERRGNTLSRVFREFVDNKKIRRRPLFKQLLSPGDIAQHYDSEEADNDGSYVDKSEDDLSFEADTEVGSLSALLRNQTLDISHLRDKGNGSGKTKKTKKKTTTTRKKPVQPPANIRKFCLFLLFLFRVLFISIY